MNSIKKIVTRLARRSLIPHVLTSLTIIAACTLLFFTNTGCDMIKLLTTYAIQFSPPYFAVGAPGEQGVVQATLMWSSDDTTRELEAQTWTVDSGLPPILESATWTPKQNSDLYRHHAEVFVGCKSLWSLRSLGRFKRFVLHAGREGEFRGTGLEFAVRWSEGCHCPEGVSAASD